jgi:hypothetical protein
LGWIGVSLVALILISGYRRAVKAFRSDPEFGGLMLAYIVTATFYSLTEAGFRFLAPMWIFLLLAVVGASGVNAGLFRGKASKALASRRGAMSSRQASTEFIPESRTVCAPAVD